MKSAVSAIRSAERILPGRAARPGATDHRWQAIIAVAEFVETNPKELWEFTAKWGCHRSEDLRMAIATCILEHLLEHHFRVVFPKASALARSNANFAQTLRMCSLFGQAARASNARAFRTLVKEVRHAI